MVSLAAIMKLADEVGGAVVDDGLEGLDLAVDDDGVGFDAVEVEGSGGHAGGVEALGGGILEAELGGEGGVGDEEGLVAAVGAGLVFKEGAGGGVGELGLVADEGGVDGGLGEVDLPAGPTVNSQTMAARGWPSLRLVRSVESSTGSMGKFWTAV